MKDLLILALVTGLLFSCGGREKKITVSKIENSKGDQLHWYVYSLPTTYSQSYIELIPKGTSKPVEILTSSYVTDVRFVDDKKIGIECHQSDYELLNARLKEYSVNVDTNGNYLNGMELRINNTSFKYSSNCFRSPSVGNLKKIKKLPPTTVVVAQLPEKVG